MRSPTETIWKTVVFAAAMLGGSVALNACTHHDGMMMDPCKDKKDKKMPPEGGASYGGATYGGDAYGKDAWGDDGSGYGDPDDGRSRGGDDEGSSGRGFVLS